MATVVALVVILSEARDLLCSREKQIPRFAQDDNGYFFSEKVNGSTTR
jgi:hypothetical protein